MAYVTLIGGEVSHGTNERPARLTGRTRCSRWFSVPFGDQRAKQPLKPLCKQCFPQGEEVPE